MVADLAGPDPKSLWKDQDEEADAVTLQQVHALVRRYDRRTRRRGAILAILLVAIGATGVYNWSRLHDPVTTALFVGGELGALYLVWRQTFPARDPAEPAGAYLQRRLRLRLAYLEGGWLRAALPLLPVVVWMGYHVLRREQAPIATRIAPFAIVAAALAFAAVRARHRARQVRAELRELKALLER